jgi:hypothetical protein
MRGNAVFHIQNVFFKMLISYAIYLMINYNEMSFEIKM